MHNSICNEFLHLLFREIECDFDIVWDNSAFGAANKSERERYLFYLFISFGRLNFPDNTVAIYIIIATKYKMCGLLQICEPNDVTVNNRR